MARRFPRITAGVVLAAVALLAAAPMEFFSKYGVPAANAQQTATPAPAIIRLPAGVVFEVPAGWGWSGLSEGGPNFVTLDYEATRPQQGAAHNINKMQLLIPQEANLPKYVRVDSEKSERLANGATLNWRMGQKFQLHYGYDAVVLLGSKHLAIRVLDSAAASDKTLVHNAVLKIAGSMRDVPQSNSAFHPSHRFAVDRGFKNWRPTFANFGVSFQCATCGTNRILLNVYPVEAVRAGPFADMDAASAHLASVVENSGVKPAEMRRAAWPDAEIRWSEQPATPLPLTGIMKRGSRTFFVSLVGDLPSSFTMDAARADFMAIARSVQPWDGR